MERCRFLDCFCYVCGHIVPKEDRKKKLLNEDSIKIYKDYFRDEMDLSEEPYTPNTMCPSCYTLLLGWAKKDNKNFPFMTPMIWLEDSERHDESR